MEEFKNTDSQREQLLQRLAGVYARLEQQGVGAAFYRAAKPDPVGDMGFLGSLMFHAMICGPLEALAGEYIPVGFSEHGSTLALGLMEGVSVLDETRQESRDRSPRSAFYPLGRNKSKVKQGKAAKKFKQAAALGRNTRFSYAVQGELAFMFELMDLLASEERRVHLAVKPPSPAPYTGVERRRRARPEGLYSA